MTDRSVAIGCFVDALPPIAPGDALVACDVIRATTTAVTAVARERQCFVARDLPEALKLAARCAAPLLLGELKGDMPSGFHLNNSPVAVEQDADLSRPIVMLSTSGTRLLRAANGTVATYVACLRNFAAVSQFVAARHARILVVGAASRGEFREEDQICCAWIVRRLLQAGFSPEDVRTVELVERWGTAPAEALEVSNSVAYLRRSNQLQDLEFILRHVDDLDLVCAMKGAEVTACAGSAMALAGVSAPHRVQVAI